MSNIRDFEGGRNNFVIINYSCGQVKGVKSLSWIQNRFKIKFCPPHLGCDQLFGSRDADKQSQSVSVMVKACSGHDELQLR